jgi:hypothetical protein
MTALTAGKLGLFEEVEGALLAAHVRKNEGRAASIAVGAIPP